MWSSWSFEYLKTFCCVLLGDYVFNFWFEQKNKCVFADICCVQTYIFINKIDDLECLGAGKKVARMSLFCNNLFNLFFIYAFSDQNEHSFLYAFSFCFLVARTFIHWHLIRFNMIVICVWLIRKNAAVICICKLFYFFLKLGLFLLTRAVLWSVYFWLFYTYALYHINYVFAILLYIPCWPAHYANEHTNNKTPPLTQTYIFLYRA